MKATIDGIEVEGTPDEIFYLVERLHRPKKREPEKAQKAQVDADEEYKGYTITPDPLDPIEQRPKQYKRGPYRKKGSPKPNVLSLIKDKNFLKAANLVKDGATLTSAICAVFGYKSGPRTNDLRKVCRKLGVDVPSACKVRPRTTKKEELAPSTSDLMNDKRMMKAVQYIKEGKNLSTACRLVWGYTGGSLTNNVRRLCDELSIEVSRKRNRRKTSTSSATDNVSARPSRGPQRERMRFLTQRAKSLCYDNKMDYQSALRKASEEWGQKGKKVKVQVGGAPLPPKPAIFDDPEKNDLFFELAKNVIANKGKMTYANEGALFGFGVYDQWMRFLSRVVLNSKGILEYFNAKGKLVYARYGNTTCLQYEG